jgi:hypothetical protein
MSDIPTNGTTWRLSSLESRVSTLENHEPAVIVERVRTLNGDYEELKNEIRSLRRALYSFALSVALAAIIFGVTMLQVVK